MKVKMDFVTNSSSTSFVAWGITLDIDRAKEMIGEDKLFDRKGCSDHCYHREKCITNEDAIKFCGIEELIKKSFNNKVLYCEAPREEEKVLIGAPISGLKDDQTLLSYKEMICDELSKIGVKREPKHIRYIEELDIEY